MPVHRNAQWMPPPAQGTMSTCSSCLDKTSQSDSNSIIKMSQISTVSVFPGLPWYDLDKQIWLHHNLLQLSDNLARNCCGLKHRGWTPILLRSSRDQIIKAMQSILTFTILLNKTTWCWDVCHDPNLWHGIDWATIQQILENLLTNKSTSAKCRCQHLGLISPTNTLMLHKKHKHVHTTHKLKHSQQMNNKSSNANKQTAKLIWQQYFECPKLLLQSQTSENVHTCKSQIETFAKAYSWNLLHMSPYCITETLQQLTNSPSSDL